jgi:nicotinamidase-related amidase
MRQALLIIDVQPSFTPPPWLIANIAKLLPLMPSVATVERHDEAKVPFKGQLDWAPGASDDSLIKANRVFIKYGYAPTPETIAYLRDLKTERILVCGIQADTCVLAAGFALFDAGLRPTLIADLIIGSSLDRSGALGARLWKHHFGAVIESHAEILTAPNSI